MGGVFPAEAVLLVLLPLAEQIVVFSKNPSGREELSLLSILLPENKLRSCWSVVTVQRGGSKPLCSPTTCPRQCQ